MENIVKKLTENRQVELAKSILESNGYKVAKKSTRRKLRESIIDEISPESIDIKYFKENGFSSQEIDLNTELFQDVADLLGVKLERVRACDEEMEGFDALMDLIGEDEPISSQGGFPAPTLSLFQKNGVKLVLSNEMGFFTIFFSDKI